jgi:hypothetical protein
MRDLVRSYVTLAIIQTAGHAMWQEWKLVDSEVRNPLYVLTAGRDQPQRVNLDDHVEFIRHFFQLVRLSYVKKSNHQNKHYE